MQKPEVYIIELNKPQIDIIGNGLFLIKFMLREMSTDFSRKLYNSGIVDEHEVDAFVLRLGKIKAKTYCSFSVTEAELLIIYTSHYIGNCFIRNDEAFLKWQEYEHDKVEDVNDFRCRLLNVQMVSAVIIENCGLCEKTIQERKEQLQSVFGKLYDSEGHETLD